LRGWSHSSKVGSTGSGGLVQGREQCRSEWVVLGALARWKFLSKKCSGRSLDPHHIASMVQTMQCSLLWNSRMTGWWERVDQRTGGAGLVQSLHLTKYSYYYI